jgi:hypothetical protein
MSAMLIIMMLVGDVYTTTEIEFTSMVKCNEAKNTLQAAPQFKRWATRFLPIMECVYK